MPAVPGTCYPIRTGTTTPEVPGTLKKQRSQLGVPVIPITDAFEQSTYRLFLCKYKLKVRKDPVASLNQALP